MKTAKKLVLAAVVLPLTLGTASAFAFGGKDHKGHRGECGKGMDRGIMRQLDLTDAQKDQLKEMREANKAAMKAKFADGHEAHMQSVKRTTIKFKHFYWLITSMKPQQTT